MARTATQVLEEEHRIVQRVASSLAALGQEIERGRPVSAERVRILGQFLEVFVRQCHQRKEEQLFSLLEKKGVPAAGCPIAILNHEHAKFLILVSQYINSVGMYVVTKGEAWNSLANTIHALVTLLPGHIWKEDYLLLPLADKVLTSNEQDTLLLRFAQVESELGPEIHHAFERLAEHLEEAVQPCNG